MDKKKAYNLDKQQRKHKGEAKFFDKDIFFSFQFFLINLYLLGVDIYWKNQSTANKKEAENTNTYGVDKLNTGKIDTKKSLGTGIAVKSNTIGADIKNHSITSKTDAKKGSSIGEANK